MKQISNNDLFMNDFNFSAIGMAIVSMDGRWNGNAHVATPHPCL
ncbi:hypothetical protein [Bacillus sp. V3B]|nr:hypothetical protein [Bacillus sp. V3B]